MNKSVKTIIIVFSLLSPMIAFAILCNVGEVDIFGIAGMIRYSWIMWLFIPVAATALLAGIWSKKSKQKYKHFIIIGGISLGLLVVFGSYWLIFKDNNSYTKQALNDVQQQVETVLPQDVKIATTPYDEYILSYAKILNAQELADFNSEVQSNLVWKDSISPKIKSLLPYTTQVEVETCEYFLFFNKTTQEYNTCPTDGEHECIFIAYDVDLNKLIIVSDYMLSVY